MGGYIGVNNKARTIKKMYVGINGLARKINGSYIGVPSEVPIYGRGTCTEIITQSNISNFFNCVCGTYFFAYDPSTQKWESVYVSSGSSVSELTLTAKTNCTISFDWEYIKSSDNSGSFYISIDNNKIVNPTKSGSGSVSSTNISSGQVIKFYHGKAKSSSPTVCFSNFMITYMGDVINGYESKDVAREWFWYVPNDQYEDKNVGTWANFSQVDDFFNRYNHDNHYDGLKIGNYVSVAYPAMGGYLYDDWVIAGFDMEHKQTAADGTVYDNGYGICFIPKKAASGSHGGLDERPFNRNEYPSSYSTSTIHTDYLQTLYTDSIRFGGHIVNRNVLLSSSNSGGQTPVSNGYTWTTATSTLLSGYQLTGQAAKYKNKYDDGEANYKLPLFNYETDIRISSYVGDNYWIRGAVNWSGSYSSTKATLYIIGAGSSSSGAPFLTTDNAKASIGVRPMIYLR